MTDKSRISDYPHLTRTEFTECIRRFSQTYRSVMSESQINSSHNLTDIRVTQGTRPYLIITSTLRALKPADGSDSEDAENEENIEDADPIDRSRPSEYSPEIGTVEYHVVYSPTWRVPVMYLRVTHIQEGVVTDLDKIKKLLIEDRCVRQAVGAVEFGGALGMQDHPELNIPFMYLHPCHTGTLLETVASGDDVCVGVGQYIAAWISLIGPAVGIFLPAVETGTAE